MTMRMHILLLALLCCFGGSKLSAQYPLSTTMSLEGYVNRSGKIPDADRERQGSHRLSIPGGHI
jgi:hypothetical protein